MVLLLSLLYVTGKCLGCISGGNKEHFLYYVSWLCPLSLQSNLLIEIVGTVMEKNRLRWRNNWLGECCAYREVLGET